MASSSSSSEIEIKIGFIRAMLVRIQHYSMQKCRPVSTSALPKVNTALLSRA